MAYRRVNLVWGTEEPVMATIGRSFLTRLLGLRAHGVDAMVMAPVRLHTFGFAATIVVVSVESDGVVTQVVSMGPNRMMTPERAAVVIELASSVIPPAVGERIVALPSSDDARHPHPLRDPHRQSR